MFTDCCHYLLILSIYCAFNLSKLGFFCWGASPGYAAKTRFSAALQLYNIFFTMCFFSAIACFMCSNFSLSNVFTNSNVNTPLLFQISATWSNHEGSLLLWCWLLTFFGRSLDKSKVLYERQSLAPRNPSSANTCFFLWGAESGLSFTTFRFCDDAMTSSNLKRPSRTSQTRSRGLSESLEYLQLWALLGSPHSLSRRGAFRDHLVGAPLDEVFVYDMRRVRSPDVTTSENAGRNSKVSFKKGRSGAPSRSQAFGQASESERRTPKAAQGPMYNIRTLIKTSVTGVYADFNTAIFRGFFRSRCLLIYLFIVLFFALFLLTTSNPFLKNQFLSFNSIAELNPVLQDPVLAIHPPCIYTGYVASAVGFTLCLSRSLYVLHFFGGSLKKRWKMGSVVLQRALPEVLGRPERDNRPIVSAAQGRLTSAPELCRFFFYDDNFVYNDIWLHIRFWISICWSFLTLGILLGSWWAYHELGWGGWWFWDPVENASLMPWLFATACIHSVLLPRLNYWTLFFNLFTFVLSVLGTFFVRSGLLASVHSFATDSTRGFFLLTFLVCIAALAPLQWFGLLILGGKPRLTTGTPLLKGAWSTGVRRSLSLAWPKASDRLGAPLRPYRSLAWGPSVSARSAVFNTEPAQCARDLRDYLLFSRQLLNENLLGDPKSSIRAPFCRQTLSGLARRRRPAEQRDKGRGWGGNRPQKQIEQLLQLQNCLFLILTGIVLCGTAAPILFQLFSDRDVTTGAPFFNGTIVPLVCCILLMLIFVHGLMLQFCKLKASLLPRKRQFTPKISGVLAQFVYNFMEGLKLSKTSVDYGLACFVLVAITMIFVHFFAFYFVAEFSVLESTYCVLCFTLFCILLLSTSKIGVLGGRSLSLACLRAWAKRAIGSHASDRQEAPSAERRTPPKSRSLPAAPFLLASSSNLRAPIASNMKIAHTGLLVFITGVLLSNRKKTHCSLQMRSSFELRLGQKICCLRSIDQNVGPTFRSICGNVIIYQQRLKPSRYGEPFPPTDLKQLKDAFVMFPETRFSFSNPELSTTKVAIHTNLLSDIYMLIGTGSTDSGWFVTTMQLPYIFCIWLGFLLAAIAGFNSIALLLKQQRLNWA